MFLSRRVFSSRLHLSLFLALSVSLSQFYTCIHLVVCIYLSLYICLSPFVYLYIVFKPRSLPLSHSLSIVLSLWTKSINCKTIRGKMVRNTVSKASTFLCLSLSLTLPPCRVGLVVSVSTSYTVGREFASRPGHNKDYHKNGTNCLPAWHAMR